MVTRYEWKVCTAMLSVTGTNLLQLYYNCLFTTKQVEIVDTLIRQYKINPDSIATITPYSAQKEEIRKELDSHGLKAVKAKSITDSQGVTQCITQLQMFIEIDISGSEFGIVIMSTVRSMPVTDLVTPSGERRHAGVEWIQQHLGFITDTHQINVGITRCKYGLAIVGELDMMCIIPLK